MKLSVTGTTVASTHFATLKKYAENQRPHWVGSNVHYGPYHEFGTVKMQARPHWRPAIRLVSLERDFFSNDPLALLKTGVPKIVALRIERLVKKVITHKHIIDTGNYRGSVVTGRTEAEVIQRSNSRKKSEDR